MKKAIQSLINHSVPTQYSREDWKLATISHFSPYFRRPAQLRRHIDIFMMELRNLARITPHPDHLLLLEWCLALYRRVLRVDRTGAYGMLHRLFDNMEASNARWLNMFHTTVTLDPQSAPQDVAFQLFETIDGVAEGCFKPQLQILYEFAVREEMGTWPISTSTIDFGTLVAKFPTPYKNQVPILLNDPDLKIGVNQWRNIAAHKSYKLVGPKTIEVTYGRGNVKTTRLGIQRLSKVSRWLLMTHQTVRLANTIIFIEHMKEIVALGKPSVSRTFSASVVQVGHNLSTVGFEVVDWKEATKDGLLIVKDRLNRDPTEALVHASQQLVSLSIGVLADVATRKRIKRVGVQLLLPNDESYGAGFVAVSTADAFSLRKISLACYMKEIEWRRDF